jgi:hypothetical protein
MPEGRLEDDGGLSSDFIFVNGVPDGIDHTPEAMWIGVRRGFGPDGEQMEEPSVWIQHQEEYMNGPLTGFIAMSPDQWRDIVKAVEWRLNWYEIGAQETKEVMPPADGGPEES